MKVLGLTGLPGVGKTTLATAMYDRLKDTAGYLYSCFVPDVRAGQPVQLQRKLLRDLAHLDREPLDPLEGDSRNIIHAVVGC